ncbi:MAG: BolA/IbaG family iron-sulfur metabolism protein [Gammaproteobacteria bacterium]|nr:BolA/IbaG family iron-sulfur metabolism protein [Gammaproteobacteria bacterium]
MSEVDIKSLIEKGIPGAEVILGGDGCNANVIVISDAFDGQSMLKQQKMVYATLGDLITNGTIHALSIKSYTPTQWDAIGNHSGQS